MRLPRARYFLQPGASRRAAAERVKIMEKKRIAFFDTKPYDRKWFDALSEGRYEIEYFESRMTEKTAGLAAGADAACVFVNDEVNAAAIDVLCENGVRLLLLRCAGYSNVDRKYAFGKMHILRVPAYSPHAVAEHAAALLLTLNRHLHKAYNRTRDFNFSIAGLEGVDLYGKTAGIVGTGRIGRAFADICRGFGMKVVAYDKFQAEGFEYLPLRELFAVSDVISLHCPLNEESRYMINKEAFECMKDGVMLINTSRGELVDSHALLEALNSGKVGAAGLDVYDEEEDVFFNDRSGTIVKDDTLSLLLTRPNVLITSHQAFLTSEALKNIAQTTLDNADAFFSGGALENEVCYHCSARKLNECRKKRGDRCFRLPDEKKE